MYKLIEELSAARKTIARLEAEVSSLQKIVESMAKRIAAQSELLTKKSEP
jgi:hypothetical protein